MIRLGGVLRCVLMGYYLVCEHGRWSSIRMVLVVGKEVGTFRSWAEEMRSPILKIGLGSRISKLGDGPNVKIRNLHRGHEEAQR